MVADAGLVDLARELQFVAAERELHRVPGIFRAGKDQQPLLVAALHTFLYAHQRA
jgi:hypothetical protein